MSREIDTSDLKKLSQDDLKYLRDRGQLSPEQEAELLDEEDDEEDDEEEETSSKEAQKTSATAAKAAPRR
jgi:hypothetical protein